MAHVVTSTPETLAIAARTLRQGRLVAFPTETVYGLGAAARDARALALLYATKGRPADHPVIVHLPDADHVGTWARDVPEAARALAASFWPGPLTLVLRRTAIVPDAVTGGQDTIGLRVPSHPVARALLDAFGDGVAAPSANRFGRISPTTAEHVAQEFDDVDLLVLDGGACQVGVESTIVDLSGDRPRLLRPGGIGLRALQEVLGEQVSFAPHLRSGASEARDEPPAPRAPGGLERHYAPRTATELLSPARLDARLAADAGAIGVLARRPVPAGFGGSWIELPDEPEAYARRLYAALRRLDDDDCRRILVEDVPPLPEWFAIRDRLMRASAGAATAVAATSGGERA